jgi:hypothetical protein
VHGWRIGFCRGREEPTCSGCTLNALDSYQGV